MESIETECLECGVVDDWEYWDEVGRQRYVGEIGKILNVDATKHSKCPHCGSTKGRLLDDDESEA